MAQDGANRQPEPGRIPAASARLALLAPGNQDASNNPTVMQAQAQQAQLRAGWLSAAQQVAQAGDQLGQSLRQLYVSASSVAGPGEPDQGQPQCQEPGAGEPGPPPSQPGPHAQQQQQPPPPLYQNLPGVVPYYRGRSVGPPPSYDDVVNPYAAPPTYQSLFGQMREARKSSRNLLDLLRRLLLILASTLGCTILIAFMIIIPFTMIIVGAVYIDECRIEHIPAFLLVGGLVWASKNVLHCYGQCRKQSAAERLAAQAADQLYASSLSSSTSSTSGELDEPTGAAAATRLGVAERQQQQQQLPGSLVLTAELTNQLELTSGGAERHLANRQQAAAQFDHRNHRRLKSSICESLLNCVLFGWFIAGCVIVLRNYEPDFDQPSSPRYCHRTVYMYTFWLVSSAMLLFGLFIGSVCCLMVSSAMASRQDELDLA